MINLLWLTFIVYLVVQVGVLWLSSGTFWWVAGLPLLGMVPVSILTIGGLLQDCPTWPNLLLTMSPLVLLYVLGVAIVGMRKRAFAGI